MDKITFVIPLRDEINNLRKNIKTYSNIVNSKHQLILIDDDSSDGTFEFLMKNLSGATIINATLKKENVVGKNNAIMCAYDYIENDYICFVDADVYNINIEEIENLVLNQAKNEVYTTIPKFINEKFVENFSLFFEQILFFDFHVLNTNSELFGGFYIISKENYDLVGGHEAIKNEIVEDLAMAKILLKNNINIKVFRSNHLYIRMYDSYHSLFEGWSKNVFHGFAHINKLNSVILFFYIFFIFLFLFSIPVITYLLLTVIYIITVNYYLKTNNFFMFFWPLFLFNFVFIFLISLIKKKKSWKGREY